MQQFANSTEVGADSGLIRATTFPVQKQGFYDLPAVWVLNRLQGCAASERGHLLVHPVLNLLLDNLLEVVPRFGIAKESLFEFAIFLHV